MYPVITYCKTDQVYILLTETDGRELGRYNSMTEAKKAKWKILDQQMLAEKRK